MTDQAPHAPEPRRSESESEARLARLKVEAKKTFKARERHERKRSAQVHWPRLRWWQRIFIGIGMVVVPFFVLVRMGVWLYLGFGMSPWLALGLASAITAILVGALAATLSKRWTGQARLKLITTRFAVPLVLAYCGYALLYLSSDNAKTEAVADYYTSLHPVFRLALSTATLWDRDLVVTDVHRTPADYVAMGLPVREASYHYRQDDGYVHAVDLRTIGRAGWRTALLRLYFRGMGFRTLRHIGTADHLHVSLRVRD